MFTAGRMTLLGALLGFALLFVRRWMSDPLVFVDLAGSIGYSLVGAVLGAVAGRVLYMILRLLNRRV